MLQKKGITVDKQNLTKVRKCLTFREGVSSFSFFLTVTKFSTMGKTSGQDVFAHKLVV